MFNATYISCPIIGFQHTLEITTKEYNKVNGSPQYDVHYPNSTLYTLENLLKGLSAATKEFLTETRAAFDKAYDEYLDADLITISSTPVFEMADDEYLDADLIDVTMEENGDGNEIDEPACGDCGGCCECLGDPPDCRWDTTRERDEELAS